MWSGTFFFTRSEFSRFVKTGREVKLPPYPEAWLALDREEQTGSPTHCSRKETPHPMKQRPTARKAKAPKRAQLPEHDLLEACVEALRERVPAEAHERPTHKRLHGHRPDFLLKLRVDGREVLYVVEAKRVLQAPHLGPLTHMARELERCHERLLVCAERVPDRLGEELQAHGIAYIDRGGNACLRAPGLFVLITGRPPVKERGGRQDLRGTEVRLLGVFLTYPQAGQAVQTELALRAGIALGAVGRGREKLVRLGILDRTDERRWRVRDRAEGLRRFGEGWGAVVRYKLNPRAHRMLEVKGQGDLRKRLAARPKLGCLLGGELAAAHLTHHLQTEHATLHVPADRREEVARALTLVPDDRGPVTLLDRYGRGDEHRTPALPGVPLAHPLLVWAECLTVTDERVAQTAARLYDELQRGADE